MPDGALLIGFRSPLVNGKAIVVSLTNPQDVLAYGVPAKFGEVIRLTLGDNGIRSMDRVGDRYLIVAGSFKDNAGHSLYWWSGIRKDKPVPVLKRIGSRAEDFRPEALFPIENTSQLQLLGDEGDVAARKKSCKDAPPEARTFRGIVIQP
jgi:hypothetical protein